jgi:cohesin complex subunit SCC1
MFYSQIILAKKGPLGQVWQAAHWGERKLGRPAVFSTDIAAITSSIANPVAPMALRVSGHLLLGIVRIYSRQVQFLLDDCHQAMIKVKMAYSGTINSSNATDGSSGGPMIDITLTTRGGAGNAASSSHSNKSSSLNSNALNVSNFGEYNDFSTSAIANHPKAKKNLNDMMDSDYFMTTTTTHFAIPLEELLQRASAVQGVEHNDDDWVPAELDDSTLHLSNNLVNISAATMPESGVEQSQLNNNGTEEEWGVFDPNDGEEEVEQNGANKSLHKSEDDGSATHLSDIEVTRAVNDSATSDPVRFGYILVDLAQCSVGILYSIHILIASISCPFTGPSCLYASNQRISCCKYCIRQRC